jgi:GH35 family endo-1,4-beta-xylanase
VEQKEGPVMAVDSRRTRSRIRTAGWFSVILFAALSTATSPGAAVAQQWLTDANNRIAEHRQADLTVSVVDTLGNAVPNADVHVAMTGHDFRFGTAVTAQLITSNSPAAATYREKLLENFNEVVFENDLKYPPWIGEWGPGFNWPQTEAALDWLDANGLPARGHYLSWATWSGNDAWGNSENINTLGARLLDHITDKVQTVGDRVYEWDVINHPVGWLGDTYENRLENAGLYDEGLDFYAEIINHARAVAPEGMAMWINEDDVIAGNSRASEYERINEYLIDQGAAPDGIAFQGHFVEEWGRLSSFNRQPQTVYDRIDRFAALSDRLRVTEFDIDVGGTSPQDEQEQAELLHDFMTVMFSHPNMEAITMWGFWEGAHWRPDAALFREDWSEKPALTAYQQLVFDEWWTDEMGNADDQGDFATRAFKGLFDITVTHDGQEYVRSDVLLTNDLQLEIVVDAASLDGDFNGDGIVNAADYVVWRNGLDTDYVQSDYDVWVEHFGNRLEDASGTVAAVPEPSSWFLLAISTMAGLRRWRLSHSQLRRLRNRVGLR